MRLFHRRTRARPEAATPIAKISRAARAHLDGEAIIRCVVEEVQRALRPDRTVLWLTTGETPPRRAHCAGLLGSPRADDEAPAPVAKAAARRRSVAADPIYASPIIAPRSGLLGVLHVEAEHVSDGLRAILEGVAAETGFALETASLYEQAVAEKERTEAILGRVGDAIVVTDLSGRVHQWNQAARWFFDRSGEEVRGRGCAESLGLHRGDEALDCSRGCALIAAAGEAESVLGVEVWRPLDDDRRQPLSANVSLVKDQDGAAYEVVHSFRDITRIKEADEAKTMFLATASHELKTPLTVIQGFAQLLSDPRYSNGAGDPGQALEAIERRARQLGSIVERLLLSSRIEAGRAEVRLAPTDLSPLVRTGVEEFSASQGRTVNLVAPDEVPSVTADVDAAVTIVQHLLDNAVKYSPEGQDVEVRIEVDERHVSVVVRDQGIGMAPDQMARCFDRFWQAESHDGRRFAGTGIGLYIVRSLAEAMGGTITVESALGAGSTFTMSLRRTDAAAAAAEPPPPAPAEPEPSVIREFMRQIGVPQRR